MHYEIGMIIGSGNYRYRVDALIAEDALGPVYQVQDIHRDRTFALRPLPTQLAGDPDALARAREAADAAADLAHSNILPVYSLEGSGERVYLVSQFVPGVSLLDRLNRQPHQPVPLSEVMIILKAVVAALEYAHHRDLVHGHLHPGKIRLGEAGDLSLDGFGLPWDLAAGPREDEPGLYALQYRAPETFTQGKFPMNPATDVYALGVLLYEVLTRQLPFSSKKAGTGTEADSPRSRIIRGILKQAPADPSLLNPDIPLELAQVILRALQKYPGDRFPSPHYFFAATCRALDVDPDEIPDQLGDVSEPSKAAFQAGVAPTWVSGLPKWVRKRGLALVGIVLILAILAGFLIRGIRTGLTKPVDLPVSSPQIPTQREDQTAEQPRSTTTGTSAPTPTSAGLVRDPSGLWLNPADGAPVIKIESGEFTMGSDRDSDPYFWGAEQPQHPITLDEYWIYRTEVSNQMYRDCVIAKGCPMPERYNSAQREQYFNEPQFDDYPAVNITWVGAGAYCAWAGGRLPTEAEWEKAARGADARLFSWGNDHSTGDQANFCDSRCLEDTRDPDLDDGYSDTAPVGSYPAGASPYGVLDMSGNVWEWVYDWFDPLYYEVSPKQNPQGPDSGTRHVIRGGSFFNPSDGVRVVARASLRPEDSKVTVGFRCVLER